MTRAGPLALVVLLTVAMLAPTAGLVGATPTPDSPASGLVQQGEFDSTEFVVTVYPNGSARWTFRYFRTLSNESERTSFETYAEKFRTTETQLYTDFKSRANDLTARGSDVTGREMAARNFAKDAYLSGATQSRGVVEMSFTWSAFGVVDGDRVVVADVFQGGFYIAADQELVFDAGPNLRVADADPEPDDRATTAGETQSITYEGETEFNDRKPKVVFAPTGGGGATPTDAGSGPGGDGGLGFIPLLAGAVVLLLGLVAAYAYRSGEFGGGSEAASTASGGGGSSGAAATEPAVPDEELLSDEDRVLQLLEEHGGRMKQVDIVDETDWSKSKVSMLLSDMEDEDTISKLRVGRENIVSLSGHEPDAAGSPFDDEE